MTLSERKIIIVGGAGFIGSHLVEALLERREGPVIVVDDLSNGTSDNIAEFEEVAGFEFIEADAREAGSIEAIFDRFRGFDEIYHLAANSDIHLSSTDPSIELSRSFMTTVRVLEAARKWKPMLLIFSSTSAVYGWKEEDLSEGSGPLFPFSYYGAAKLASEAFISSYAQMNDFPATILRFPNVVGERATHGVIYDLLRKLEIDREHLHVLGDGNQTKPYLYVRDLVSAILHLRSVNAAPVDAFNIGVDSATSVRRIVQIICEEMNLPDIEIEYSGGEGGWKGDIPRFSYNLSKIWKTGWKATLSSDEAVRRAVQRIIGK